MKLAALIVRYALFAAVAMAVNLAVQRLILTSGSSLFWYGAAISAGTICGLFTKYFLDKRWIFRDLAAGVRQHGEKFSRYAFMGLFTTAIFWGSETLFWAIGKTDVMRELGAVLGLTTGYVIKYQLDARFVFNRTVPARGGR